MIVKIFKTLLFLFTFFYITLCATENRCRKCPSLYDVTVVQPIYKDNCVCKDSTFFDETTCACVRFINCTDITKLQEEVLSSINEFFRRGPEVIIGLMEGNIDDIVSDILHNISIFDSEQVESLEESKDYDIFTCVLEEELGTVFHKYSSYFISMVRNPFMRKSKSITAECGDDEMCAIEHLMQKQERKIKKIVEGLGPDLAKGFEGVEQGLKDSIEDECKPNECSIIKKGLIVYKGLKEEIWTEFKIVSELLAKQFSEHSFRELFSRSYD